ncbi:MAG: hypothetical protein DI539_13815 [Flavobacterium psychrophilum]|nr:MAG: hypothetical protein DI539_13815 [Flavobacterium psychrophilum]
MEAFISYDGLPLKSGGAHGLGNKPVEGLYIQCLDFINNHTEVEQLKIDITLYSSDNKSYSSWSLLWKMVKKFGVFTSWGSYPYVNRKGYSWRWRIGANKIDDAFRMLESVSEITNEMGPLVLSFEWRFGFTESGKVLPGQNKFPLLDNKLRGSSSRFYLRLSPKRSSASVWFVFPFEVLDEENQNFIKSIIKDLPFKVSDKHWRLWKKSKNNNWISSKIDVDFSKTQVSKLLSNSITS